MKKPAIREITLNRIARSIEESWTLEQLLSTEQFFCLYYSRFAFESHYLHREWTMDNQIREKKQSLTALEGAQSITFDPRRPSLSRLEAYVTTISLKEFQHQWAELQIQLAGIGMVEMSLYPAVCERAATLPHQVVKQANATPITITHSSLTIKQCSIDEYANQVLEVYEQAHGEAKAFIAPNSNNERGALAINKTSTETNILANKKNHLFATKDIPSLEANDILHPNHQVQQLSLVEDEVSDLGLTGDSQDSNKEAIQLVVEHKVATNTHLDEDKNKTSSGTELNQPGLLDTILKDDSSDNQLEYIQATSDIERRKKVYQVGYLATTDYAGSLLSSNEFEPKESSIVGAEGFTYAYRYKNPLHQQKTDSKSKTTDTSVANSKEDNAKEVRFEKVIYLTPGRLYNQGSAKVKPEKLLVNTTLRANKRRGNKGKSKVSGYYSRNTSSDRGIHLPVYIVKNNKSGTSSNNPPLSANKGNGFAMAVNPSTNALSKQYLKHPFYDSEIFVRNQTVTKIASETSNHTSWQKFKFSGQHTIKGGVRIADQKPAIQIASVNSSNVPVWFNNLTNQRQQAIIAKKNRDIPFGWNLVGVETKEQPNDHYHYISKEQRRERALTGPDDGTQYDDTQLKQREKSIQPKTEQYFGAGFYNAILEAPASNKDVKGDWPFSSPHRMNAETLMRYGLSVDQATIVPPYASADADHPHRILSLN